MNILHIAGVTLISNDGAKTRALLTNTFGLPLAGPTPEDEYVFSEKIGGSKHFGVWPLSQASQACFGTPTWPSDRPVPQVSIELEAMSEAAVAEAERELRAAGHCVVHPTRTEPWGQTICRLLTAEGAILGVSFAPWQHG